MAKPRPGKKAKPVQPQLPGMLPPPLPPGTTRVLPMRLRIGDRIADETGEWEVVGHPFTTAGGKNAHARVRKVSQPEFTDLPSWGAHERISVSRP
jgi:hypothetical protein